MADALILTKRDDGVAIVSTNDDPLNRMTLEYVDMFSDVVEDIAADDSIRSFVVTAEGTTNFSVVGIAKTRVITHTLTRYIKTY